MIGGDNEVAERHQKGIRSTYARVGRVCSFHEDVVGTMNICVL